MSKHFFNPEYHFNTILKHIKNAKSRRKMIKIFLHGLTCDTSKDCQMEFANSGVLAKAAKQLNRSAFREAGMEQLTNPRIPTIGIHC